MGQSQSSKNDRGRDYRIWKPGGGGSWTFNSHLFKFRGNNVLPRMGGGSMKINLATIYTLQHSISVHVEKGFDMLRSKATHKTLGELDYNLIVSFHGILIL